MFCIHVRHFGFLFVCVCVVVVVVVCFGISPVGSSLHLFLVVLFLYISSPFQKSSQIHDLQRGNGHNGDRFDTDPRQDFGKGQF